MDIVYSIELNLIMSLAKLPSYIDVEGMQNGIEKKSWKVESSGRKRYLRMPSDLFYY